MADQPGAEERRRFGVRIGVGQRKGVARIGDNMIGIAAVAGVAGELSAVAEVLPPAQAIAAMPASPGEPRYADPSTNAVIEDAFAQRDDPPDDLMPWDDRMTDMRQLVVDDMQVRAAHAAGGNLDKDMLRARSRSLPALSVGAAYVVPQASSPALLALGCTARHVYQLTAGFKRDSFCSGHSRRIRRSRWHDQVRYHRQRSKSPLQH